MLCKAVHVSFYRSGIPRVTVGNKQCTRLGCCGFWNRNHGFLAPDEWLFKSGQQARFTVVARRNLDSRNNNDESIFISTNNVVHLVYADGKHWCIQQMDNIVRRKVIFNERDV